MSSERPEEDTSSRSLDEAMARYADGDDEAFASLYDGLITPLQRQVRAGYRRLRGVPAR